MQFRLVNAPPGIKMNDPETGGDLGTTGYTFQNMADYSHLALSGPSVAPPDSPTAPPQVITYELTLTPADFSPQGSGIAMQAIETPIVQEVSLSLYRPVEEILLRERVLD